MTSIEWLENELIEKKIVRKDNLSTYHDFPTTFELLFMEAKERHKQEIIDAYVNGQSLGFDDSPQYWAEKYHQETFVSKGSDDHISDISKMVEDDVEKLAEEEYPTGRFENLESYDDRNRLRQQGFIKGYNKAKEHYELAASVRELKEYKLGFNCGYKQAKETLYTEEQMIGFAEWLGLVKNKELFENYIESLKQPKKD